MQSTEFGKSEYYIWKLARLRAHITVIFLLFLLLLSLSNSAPISRDSEETSTVLTRYIECNFDNSTTVKLSRDTFLSLQSESVIEPPLMNPQQKRLKWMERKNKGKKRKKDKKGKKPIPSIKEALNMAQYEINLGSVDNMKHGQTCKAQPFKQRIRIDGCETKTITNKFCHGTCLSFFIPRLRPRKLKLRSIFQSCSACTPSEYDLVKVKLDCPHLSTKHVVRQVYRIKKCACKSVDLNADMPTDIEATNEMPEK